MSQKYFLQIGVKNDLMQSDIVGTNSKFPSLTSMAFQLYRSNNCHY